MSVMVPASKDRVDFRTVKAVRFLRLDASRIKIMSAIEYDCDGETDRGHRAARDG
jgi:hypothetical protein